MSLYIKKKFKSFFHLLFPKLLPLNKILLKSSKQILGKEALKYFSQTISINQSHIHVMQQLFASQFPILSGGFEDPETVALCQTSYNSCNFQRFDRGYHVPCQSVKTVLIWPVGTTKAISFMAATGGLSTGKKSSFMALPFQ